MEVELSPKASKISYLLDWFLRLESPKGRQHSSAIGQWLYSQFTSGKERCLDVPGKIDAARPLPRMETVPVDVGPRTFGASDRLPHVGSFLPAAFMENWGDARGASRSCHCH